MTTASMHTVNDMLDRYERECMHDLAERSNTDYRRHIKHLRVQFGTHDVLAVTAQQIRAFVQSGPTKGKVHRIRRIAVLRKAFTEAHRKWEWVTGNPCAYMERSEPKRRDPPLSVQEFSAALEFFKGLHRIALIMELALHTGQSQSAVLGLTWARVHRQTNKIVFRAVKGKKYNRVEIDLTPKLNELLARAKELCGDSEYVVTNREHEPYTSAGFRAMWQRRMEDFEEAGHDKFTFHDIRYLARRIGEQRTARDPVDDYPQFDAALKADAAVNAPYYKVFYCIEQLIRRRVHDAWAPRADNPS